MHCIVENGYQQNMCPHFVCVHVCVHVCMPVFVWCIKYIQTSVFSKYIDTLMYIYVRIYIYNIYYVCIYIYVQVCGCVQGIVNFLQDSVLFAFGESPASISISVQINKGLPVVFISSANHFRLGMMTCFFWILCLVCFQP